jgi:hypothetical protein
MRGVSVVSVVSVVVLFVLIGVAMMTRGADSTGVVALAEAAERLEGESMRARFVMGISDASGDYAIRGEGPWAADSSRGSAETVVTYQGERPVRMTLLNIGRDYWFRIKGFQSLMPRGKRWVHSYDRAGTATSLTPSQFARLLAEADYVEEVGAARVNEQPASHYRGMLEVDELADALGGDAKEQIERMLEEQNVPSDRKAGVPIEAWLGEDGLPLRIRCSATTREESVDMTIDVLEYGVPVDVEPPPASTVIEEAEFDRLTGG